MIGLIPDLRDWSRDQERYSLLVESWIADGREGQYVAIAGGEVVGFWLTPEDLFRELSPELAEATLVRKIGF